jgi:hypothetical protein
MPRNRIRQWRSRAISMRMILMDNRCVCVCVLLLLRRCEKATLYAPGVHNPRGFEGKILTMYDTRRILQEALVENHVAIVA